MSQTPLIITALNQFEDDDEKLSVLVGLVCNVIHDSAEHRPELGSKAEQAKKFVEYLSYELELTDGYDGKTGAEIYEEIKTMVKEAIIEHRKKNPGLKVVK